MDYSKHVSTKATPQMQRSPDRPDEVENSAGGFVFAVNDWTRLDRFLILGSEGGTYYIGEGKLTRENAEAIVRLVGSDRDGPKVVDRIVQISDAGRAHKNDAAIFALAIAAKLGTDKTRAAAHAAMSKVVRTGTHLFQYAQFIEAFGGWGRGTRRAFVRWYLSKEPDQLAFQMLKYRERNGWSHADILRLAHPLVSADDVVRRAIFDYTLHAEAGKRKVVEGKTPPTLTAPDTFEKLPRLYHGCAEAKLSTGLDKAAHVAAYNLQREMLPTEWLKDEKVNKVMLAKMPLMATLRNLGRLSASGVIKPMSQEQRTVVDRLTNDEQIAKSRIHPMHYLLALKTYEAGHGFRGSLTWQANRQIIDALDEGFYKAFANVESTGKAFLLGVDVSSSMNCAISNSNITCAEAAAAMALVIAKSEPNHFIHGFTSGSGGYNWRREGDMKGFVDLKIGPMDMLADAIRKTRGKNFGGTDCALPMMYALKHNIRVDCFIVLTDSETWAGAIKPRQALVEYRQKVHPGARLVVVAMTSNGFSIADPNDAGMLDVVGFDASVPQVITEFVK